MQKSTTSLSTLPCTITSRHQVLERTTCNPTVKNSDRNPEVSLSYYIIFTSIKFLPLPRRTSFIQEGAHPRHQPRCRITLWRCFDGWGESQLKPLCHRRLGNAFRFLSPVDRPRLTAAQRSPLPSGVTDWQCMKPRADYKGNVPARAAGGCRAKGKVREGVEVTP